MIVPARLPLDVLVERMAELQEGVRAALADGDVPGALVSESERSELIRALFEDDYGLSRAELDTFATALLQVQEQLVDNAVHTRSCLQAEAARLRNAGRGAGVYLETAGYVTANEEVAGR